MGKRADISDAPSPVSRADVAGNEPLFDEQPEIRFTEPVRSLRTFESVIDNILAGIERSRLRVGDRLPNEGELAGQLAVSKPTLRQALRVLQRSGLLTVKRGKSGGIFLNSDYLPTDEISTNIEAEEHSVIETLRARRLIEGTVAHDAFRRANEDDLTDIRRTVDLLLSAGIRSAEILRADMMFHRAIARASHNRVLEDVLHVIYQYLAPIRGAFQESKEEAARIYEIHQRQLDAMTARDVAAFEDALDAHFRFLEDRVAASMGRSWEECSVSNLVDETLPSDLRSQSHHLQSVATPADPNGGTFVA